MTDWLEKRNAHSIDDSLSDLGIVLKQISKLKEKDQIVRDAISRISAFRDYLMQSLKQFDPIITPFSTLDTLNKHISTITSRLQQYSNTGGENFLEGALSTVDVAISQANFPLIQNSQDIEGLHDSIVAFRRSMGQHSRHLTERFKETNEKAADLEHQLSELEKAIDNQKARTDNFAGQAQQQLNAVQQDTQQQFTSMIRDYQNKFAQNQEKRSEQVEGEMKDFREKTEQILNEKRIELNALLKEQKEAISKTQEDTSLKVNELIEKIEEHRDKAEELLGIISKSAMSSGYKGVADTEGKRAFAWHIAGILAACGLIVFAIIAFKETLSVDVKWSVFGARVFVASAFALFAAYAERQANRHRHIERVNRRWQLVLASLNPYLADLNEDDQKEIKKRVAETVFTSTFPTEEKDSETISPTSLFQLIKNISTNLSKR